MMNVPLSSSHPFAKEALGILARLGVQKTAFAGNRSVRPARRLPAN